MIMKFAVWLGVFWAALAPVIGRGGQIGEPAPPLLVKEWIKGKPVEIKPGTNIFVVEIFSTWSLASRASITNLNSIQKRFQGQGVVVVGVSDESADQITKFVLHDGAMIEYAIAADDQRKTSLSYMMPVKQRGVPCAFVVGKDGRLLWYGHPLHGLEQALDRIIAGRYNVDQAAKADLARSQMGQYLELARKGDPRTQMAGRRLVENRTNNVTQLCEVAFEIATDPKIVKRDFALASAALDLAEKLPPTNSTRVTVTRAVVLFESGKKEEGLARARQAVASAREQKEKANAETCLHTMEARIKLATTNQTSTNQIPTNRISTNPPPASRIQSPASKP
jgi:DNA-binding transcriptional regulator of glucitol operon